MSKSVILGLVRHFLSVAGGVLFAWAGFTGFDAAEIEALAGAIVVIIGFVWSAYDKKGRSQ